MEYAIIILTVITLAILEHCNKDQKYQHLLDGGILVLIVILVLIGGFRFQVGFDFTPYSIYFDRVPGLSTSLLTFANRSRFEIGFVVMSSLLKTVGLTNIASLFVSVILICVLLNISSFRKYTPYVFFSLLMYISLYFFGREMGQIRQAMATAIAFYSFRFVKDQKPLRYFATILIATSFHYTTVILLPFYYLSQIRLKRWQYIFLIVIGIAGAFVDWIRPLNDLLKSWNFGSLPYLNTEYANPVNLISIQYARRLLPAVIAVITVDKLHDRFDFFRISTNMVVFGAVLSLFFHEVAVYVERLFVPFIFFEVLLFGYSTEYFEQNSIRLLMKAGFVFYALVFLVHLFVTKDYVFFPYQNQLYNWLIK